MSVLTSHHLTEKAAVEAGLEQRRTDFPYRTLWVDPETWEQSVSSQE